MNERLEILGTRRRILARAAIGGLAIVLFGSACSGNDTLSPQTSASPNTTITRVEQTEPMPEHTDENEMYLEHEVTATIYWIGEEATEENDFISNVSSAWDSDAVETFGGVDEPERDFEPKHNTFYFALPASEFDDDGLVEGAREASPWANEIASLSEDQSLFKGRWARITVDGQTVYAQWHDVGPNEERDYEYVFGDDEPENTFGLRAGIDLSPDAASALGFDDGGETVTWQFVDEEDVPDGPWRQYPAINNGIHWD